LKGKIQIVPNSKHTISITQTTSLITSTEITIGSLRRKQNKKNYVPRTYDFGCYLYQFLSFEKFMVQRTAAEYSNVSN